MDESNTTIYNPFDTTESSVTSDPVNEQQSVNTEAKVEMMSKATAPVQQKTLSLSQRLLKEKRTSAFDWLTVYLWKDNDFFHAYNQSAYIVVNQLYTGEIKEQNNNRPLKVANYRTSEGNYILAGFPVRSLSKYISPASLQRVVEDCVEIAVPTSIIDKSIDDLNKEYDAWTKTLTDINLCKFQPKKKNEQQGQHVDMPSQSDLQSSNIGGSNTIVSQEPSIAQQAESYQESKQAASSTYYSGNKYQSSYQKKPYNSNYWANYHQQNQSSLNNGNSYGNNYGNYYSSSLSYQKPTWKYASYWNKEAQQQQAQQQAYQAQSYQTYQPSQYTHQAAPQQQQMMSNYTMFDLVRDIIRFQPEMTSPTDAMNFIIDLKQKANRLLI